MKNNTFYIQNKLLVLLVWDILVTLVMVGVLLIGLKEEASLNLFIQILAYIWVFCSGIFIIFYLLRYVTYHIKIEDGLIKERGFFSKKRVLVVSDIKKIYSQTFTDDIVVSRVRRYYSKIYHFNITNDKSNPFPLYPIKLNLIKELQKINSEIEVDNLVEERIFQWNRSPSDIIDYVLCSGTIFLYSLIIPLPFILYFLIIPYIKYFNI